MARPGTNGEAAVWPRLEVAQVIPCSDGLTAQGAVAVLKRAVVDEDELHIPPPSEKQNTVFGG
jgi:hypothetical protein